MRFTPLTLSFWSLFFIFSFVVTSHATFVEGPQFTYTNPINDFVQNGFNTQTNASTTVINYGLVSNVTAALAAGIATGTNSDIIHNYGTIGVIGLANSISLGLFDQGGSGNQLYNYGSIFATANNISIGIGCLSSNNYYENRGSIQCLAPKGIGIVFNNSSFYNVGTINSGSNCVQEFNGGGSAVFNLETLHSGVNSPAINLKDNNDLILNLGTIHTSYANAIETHGGNDLVGIGLGTPISGIIDGGNDNDIIFFSFVGITTADLRGTLLTQTSSVSAASGTLTFGSNTFQWVNFENFLAGATAYTASDFNNDGFNDLVLQNKTAVQYVAMSNATVASSSPQNVKTLSDKKARIVAVNDFDFDMKPELVVANKSTVNILTGTNFSTNFASLTLNKGEKVIGAANVGGTNFYADLIIRKKKEIRYYPSVGSNLITTSTLLYTEKEGYKFVGAGRFNGEAAIVLKKKGKLEYRSVTNLNAIGVSLSSPKGYKKVAGIADYADGGNMELIAIKGKKIAIGSKAEVYTLPKKTKLIGPR